MIKSKSKSTEGKGPAVPGFDATECLRIHNEFMRQPAQLSDAQVREIEERCGSDLERVWRRMALLSLSKSAAELKERFACNRPSAQVAAQLAAVSEEMAGRLRALSDLLHTASTRLWMVLCVREDASELLSAAEAAAEERAWPELAGPP